MVTLKKSDIEMMRFPALNELTYMLESSVVKLFAHRTIMKVAHGVGDGVGQQVWVDIWGLIREQVDDSIKTI
jgi:hypothetical protein